MKKQTWTPKHDAFCLEHKLQPAAKLLWQWLLANYQEDQEIEPHLEDDFNSWVEKYRGKGFSINTIKNALNRLVECQAVQMLKKWKWYEVRIVVFPPNWFKPKLKKNSQNSYQIDEIQPSNPVYTENEVCSSNIDIPSEDDIVEYEQVLTECENAGMIKLKIGVSLIYLWLYQKCFHRR
jgi:archaellum component FlaC